MKVLFAVSNEEVSENIVKKYQREYKEIISYKNVYYFNAILKELQKDKTYDRVVISEDLETFTHNQYDQIDKFIFEKLDNISDEASNYKGDNIPIILICSDRRSKSEQMLVKLFGISIYDALLGTDRSVEEVCKLIYKPRSKKEAKTYYKIESDDVNYKPENENDVSEVEIQNILAHYKRLGKNEEKFLESFDNIAAQYNDTQLRIICKFLPLNVRAVLEERSPKYQQVMAFNAKVSDSLRVKKDKQNEGTSEKLLKTNNNRETVLSKPVVIPNSVNVSKKRKLTKNKPIASEDPILQIEREINTYVKKENEFVKEQVQQIPQSSVMQQDVVNQQQPKRRGRPRKNPIPSENNVINEQDTEGVQDASKKRRGRPKKNMQTEGQMKIDDSQDDSIMMPGFESNTQAVEDDVMMPGFGDENQNQDDDIMMPRFGDREQNQDDDIMMPGFESKEQNQDDDIMMPGFDIDTSEEKVVMPSYQNNIQSLPNNMMINNYGNANVGMSNIEIKENLNQLMDLTSVLTDEKRVACFVGTSKNGTSFIVNNIAQILASQGISTAILDVTQNRNAYYIYTDNKDELRTVAMNCMQNLVKGAAYGIQAKNNLTVYTSLPNDNEYIDKSGEIIRTLANNYSVVLIDCDFRTPMSYFCYAQEIYLVQSMDVLTIQPLTAFLNELRSRNVLDESKLRIVLNKVERLKGVNEKLIIGGMSSYNDPAMTYMVDLFDKNMIRYISVPFDEQVYVRYLEGIIEFENFSLKGYPKNMMQILTELANMLHPASYGKAAYRPPALKQSGFTPSINSTLDQMRKY